MLKKMGWKSLILTALILLTLSSSWLLGAVRQKRVTALLPRGKTVYSTMLSEGCDPGWFYQILEDSHLPTNSKQIEAGALKKIEPGTKITMPLRCSDPPSEDLAKKSAQLVLADQKSGAKVVKTEEEKPAVSSPPSRPPETNYDWRWLALIVLLLAAAGGIAFLKRK